MPKSLWAPWRLEYIAQADEQEGCALCAEASSAVGDAESLLVHRGARAIVLLNKYPYSSGHLMVAPRCHVGRLGDLSDDEALAPGPGVAGGSCSTAAGHAARRYRQGAQESAGVGVKGAGSADH